MGQHPSKDKLRRTSSERIERIPKNDKYKSLSKKGSAKKREVQQVTQVLTAAKLSPKLSQQTGISSDGNFLYFLSMILILIYKNWCSAS
ncbi:hypothetical protein WA026_008375 [Henosepilachna vigintioctopunctata]|uniref:Uncharacterized protein n=1 Tax=Henosepilachna vigintioctopunctata TaxID=420089 RepID=A0AAW1UHA9_9CUCU